MPQNPHRNWRRLAAVAAGTCCLAAALSVPGVFAEPVTPAEEAALQDEGTPAPTVEEAADEVAPADAAEDESAADAGDVAEGEGQPSADAGAGEPGEDADAGTGDAAASDAADGSDASGSSDADDAPGDAGASDAADSSSADADAPADSDADDAETPAEPTPTPDATDASASSDADASASADPSASADADAPADKDASAEDGAALGAASSAADRAKASAQAAKTPSETLAAGGELPSGTYVLDADVKLTAAVTVPAGSEVTIDLAGHSVDASGVAGAAFTCAGSLMLTDSGSAGAVTGGATFASVVAGGSFTLGGGTVSSFSSGAATVAGTFSMTGGAISGCGATSGGAVGVADGGSFTQAGGTISGCTATADGGAVSVAADGSYELAGGTVSDCSATGNGGGVWAAGTFTLTSGSVLGCSAANGGGVCIAAGNASTMTGGTVTGCQASNGGAVYVASNLQFSMTGGLIGDEGASLSLGDDAYHGLSFSSGGNVAAECGGGIYVAGGSKVFVSGRIVGNSAHSTQHNKGGGGIFVYAGTLEVSGGAVERNYANNGGGICGNGAGVTVADAAVRGNVAWIDGANEANTGNGGGIYTAGGSLTSATGTVISGNVAKRHGGGVIASTTNITFDQCEFTDNEARLGCGGGMFFDSGAGGTKLLSGCTFSGNSASQTGGGIHSRGQFVMDGGSITACSAADCGGGISIVPLNSNTTPVFTLRGVTIGGSSAAANVASLHGGGVYIQRGQVTIEEGTKISFNTATGGNGGGIYVGGVNSGSMAASSFTMTGGAILSNYAQGATSGNGGGVYVGGKGVTFSMSGGSISNNAANGSGASGGAGGGVCLASATWAEITGGTIEGNTANTHGGGIDVGGTPDHVTIGSPDHVSAHPNDEGCPVIRDNTAVSRGGGLCIHGKGTSTVYCCDVSGNVSTDGAGGDALFQDAGTVNVGTGDAKPGGGAASNPGVRVSGNLHVVSGTINIFDGVGLSAASAVTADAGGTVNDYRDRECDIIYKMDDTASTKTSTFVASWGDELTMPTGEGMFTWPGYRITGWKDADGTVWKVNEPYTVPKGASSVEFVAQWERAAEPGYLSITTLNEGAAQAPDADRTSDAFVYRIEGTASDTGESVSLMVEVAPGKTVRVELQPGTYVVTPVAGWSWRYDGPSAGSSFTVASGTTQAFTARFSLGKQTWKSVMTVREAS